MARTTRRRPRLWIRGIFLVGHTHDLPVLAYHFRQMTTDTSTPTVKCPNILDVLNLNTCVTQMCAAHGISAEECVAPNGPCAAG